MRVGIMGLGQLGKDAAGKLSALGFAVNGWSKTPKSIKGVAGFAGARALNDFLSRTRILICMLPLTPQTEGILSRQTFDRLPAGAYVINVARGAHLIEDDLLAALDAGQLSGACLDVFETEPLPADHPFWDHAARQIAEKTVSIRHQGFFGNAMLTLDELSQSDIINIIRELDDRFVTRKPKAS